MHLTRWLKRSLIMASTSDHSNCKPTPTPRQYNQRY